MRCWYTRWQMSNALDRGELPSRMGRGHVARCAACREFGEALGALHARLSHEAHASPSPVAEAPRAGSPWLVAGPLALGTAAVVALVVATGGERAPELAEAPPAIEVSAVLGRLRGLADRVSRVFENTPLETELDDLIHDGRRGLDAVLAAGGLDRPE
jgi:hypothetical protein